MTYGRIENDEIRQNLSLPIPARLLDLVHSPAKVHERLKNGEDASLLSVEKWSDLLKLTREIAGSPNPCVFYPAVHEVIGSANCALCIDSVHRHEEAIGPVKYKEDKCRVCPLAQRAGCLEKDSPYQRVDSILSRDIIELTSLRAAEQKEVHAGLVTSVEAMLAEIEATAEGKAP